MRKMINGMMMTEEEAVERNMGLVHKVCSMYHVNGYTPGVTRDDLFSVGCIGLLLAYRDFDESKGYMFSTYAFNRIKNEIRRAIYSSGGKGFSLPHNLMVLASKIRRDGHEYEDPEWLAELYGETVNYVRTAQSFVLDFTVSKDSQVSSEDGIEGDELVNLIGGERDDLTEVEAAEFIGLLPLVFKRALELRLDGLTQMEIAEILGISQNHVSRRLKQMAIWLELYTHDPQEGKRAIRAFKRKRGIPL